jgi:hypothetical protein
MEAQAQSALPPWEPPNLSDVAIGEPTEVSAARHKNQRQHHDRRRRTMLGTILLVILILLLIGALPSWGYSRNWGYGPPGIVGVLLIVVIVLLLSGRI